jgi:hypothetical protein
MLKKKMYDEIIKKLGKKQLMYDELFEIFFLTEMYGAVSIVEDWLEEKFKDKRKPLAYYFLKNVIK